MASVVDVCNLALSHIGQDANVVSISPHTSWTLEEEKSAVFYPIARDAMLTYGPGWSFARRRVSPASVVIDSTIWAFGYALPSDCVKVLGVLAPESTDDSDYRAHDVEVNASGVQVLYTNVEQATLKYVMRQAVLERWNPLAIVALSHWLASYLAGTIAKDLKMSDRQLKLAVSFADMAVAADRNAVNAHPLSGTYVPAHILARR